MDLGMWAAVVLKLEYALESLEILILSVLGSAWECAFWTNSQGITLGQTFAVNYVWGNLGSTMIPCFTVLRAEHPLQKMTSVISVL